MYCNYCGQELDSNNECHNELCPSKINNMEPSINGFSIHEVINFIGNKNTDYYMHEFLANNEKTRFISWNFSAFFFHWIWMFYRKINVLANLYLAAYFMGVVFLPPVQFIILSIIGHILCGLFGNSIYRNHCVKKLNQFKPMAEVLSADSYDKVIQYHGGTSIALAISMSFTYSFILIFVLLFYINYSVSYLDPNDNYENPFNYFEDDDKLPYWHNNPGDYNTPNDSFDSYI